ncbi:phage tail protein [Enterobacter ludwigii]|uniref:phage tail-collar fiber domain-containing protein n=1 Tax=Enterobacter ludwigii TaxID=299767 RepID=UPI003C2C90A9
MSQTAITLAFEQWKASQAVTGEPVLLDEFVFANVPGLDASKPIDRSETLPPAAQIVHRQAVSRKGVVNENAVVHSVVLGAEVGDFSFNWIGLINKASNTLAMIVHAPLQQKLKTKDGQQGNVLTRSFLMEYNGAQTETGINTPAETWQIDFTARMAAMDERQRLENIDLYGAAAFLGNGYLVAKSGSQYYVTAGAGYVRGLRAQLAANQNITVAAKPVNVWLDVAWTGTLTSAWGVTSKITVAANQADYVQNGVQHYVFAVASIDANGNITDLRPKGSLNDQAASDALKKHEQSRNHPDATTGAKGFVQLSSATDSTSEALAATPKAVSAAAKEIRDDLRTAAYKDIVTSKTDATSGRVLTTGWMSLGGYGTDNLIAAADAKKALRNGFYAVQSEPTYDNSALISFGYDAVSQVHIIAKQGGQSPLLGVCGSTPQGNFGNWGKIYTEFQKPTALDVGAVAKTGDTMTGKLTMNVDGEAIRLQPKTAGYASYLISVDSANVNHWYVGAGSTNNADVVFNNYKGGNNSVILKTDGSLTINPTQGKSVIANGPVQIGGIGNAILNIGDNDSGLRSSVDGQVDLWSNNAKVGFWNGTTFSFTGQIIPTNYANFDGRYYTKAQSDAGYMPKTGAYTKAESDGRFQPKGSYTPAGQAYTKAESDGRFQPKGSYTPAGQAYTKAESDGRYPLKAATVIGVRVSARGSIGSTGGSQDVDAPVGSFITGRTGSNGDVRYSVWYTRALQINVNGTWKTITA